MYALLSGTLPFDETNMPSLIAKVKTAKFVIPYHLSPLATDLIKKLLIVNPMLRLSLNEIFAHPWLSNGSPIKPIPRLKNLDIDERIFCELLKHPKFLENVKIQELKENILSGENFDLFTVSYELKQYAK